MYKISYEKCVCFLFLVILAAVLSCSGFRIDDLAMTDISKRNQQHQQQQATMMLSSDGFFERLFEGQQQQQPHRHRIRHHRQLRAHHQQQQLQAHTSSSRNFKTFVQPPTSSLINEQHFAQIPSTDTAPHVPTRPFARSQRSYDQRNQKKRNHQHLCQEEDVSWKAYKANTVVVARAESMSSFHTRIRRENYTVLFNVLQRLKNSSFPVDDHVGLKFASVRSSSTSSSRNAFNCAGEHEDHRSQFLVKAKIEKSKEYILFLDAYGAHNYSVVATPEPRKKNIPQCIARVANPYFRPRPVKVEKLERVVPQKENRSKRLKLVCKVKGFPIPKISWKRNDTPLHSNPLVRITYKKRKSTLVIKSPTDKDWGRYECMARGVDGRNASKELRVERERRLTNSPTSTTIPSEKPNRGNPCNERMNKDFCLNGGRCFYLESINEYGCDCDDGYMGKRCGEVSSEQSSMYRQTPLYTCKIGLYTKYDNC